MRAKEFLFEKTPVWPRQSRDPENPGRELRPSEKKAAIIK